MQVIRSLEGYKPGPNPVITIGTYDGVHLGHKTILARIKARAVEMRGESIVLSFYPHPRLVLNPEENTLRLLQTLDEKIQSLATVGIDKLVLIPFTKEFSELTSEEFIEDVLVHTLGVRHIIIGHDHRFGHDRKGSLEELSMAAGKFGFEVEEIPPAQIDTASVSSTKIRNALAEGDVLLAERYLGYAYMLTGKVVEGRKLGRELGYPTANLALESRYKLIPANGVYAVEAITGGHSYPGMLNIGVAPTVSDEGVQKLEVHLIGFKRDIYGEMLTVRFLKRLRPEQKFKDLAALKEQMALDEQQSQAVYENSRRR